MPGIRDDIAASIKAAERSALLARVHARAGIFESFDKAACSREVEAARRHYMAAIRTVLSVLSIDPADALQSKIHLLGSDELQLDSIRLDGNVKTKVRKYCDELLKELSDFMARYLSLVAEYSQEHDAFIYIRDRHDLLNTQVAEAEGRLDSALKAVDDAELAVQQKETFLNEADKTLDSVQSEVAALKLRASELYAQSSSERVALTVLQKKRGLAGEAFNRADGAYQAAQRDAAELEAEYQSAMDAQQNRVAERNKAVRTGETVGFKLASTRLGVVLQKPSLKKRLQTFGAIDALNVSVGRFRGNIVANELKLAKYSFWRPLSAFTSWYTSKHSTLFKFALSPVALVCGIFGVLGSAMYHLRFLSPRTWKVRSQIRQAIFDDEESIDRASAEIGALGAELLESDPSGSITLEMDESRLEEVSQQIADLEAKLQRHKKHLGNAESNLAAAESEYSRIQAEKFRPLIQSDERLGKIAEKWAKSKQVYDNAVLAVDEAQQKLNDIRSELETTHTHLAEKESEQKRAAAAVRQAGQALLAAKALVRDRSLELQAHLSSEESAKLPTLKDQLGKVSKALADQRERLVSEERQLLKARSDKDFDGWVEAFNSAKSILLKRYPFLEEEVTYDVLIESMRQDDVGYVPTPEDIRDLNASLLECQVEFSRFVRECSGLVCLEGLHAGAKAVSFALDKSVNLLAPSSPQLSRRGGAASDDDARSVSNGSSGCSDIDEGLDDCVSVASVERSDETPSRGGRSNGFASGWAAGLWSRISHSDSGCKNLDLERTRRAFTFSAGDN